MKVVNRLSLNGLLAALLAFAGGSGGGDRPATYEVTGQVAYNGKPLEGASVSFWAENSSRAAEGTTDTEGKFSLSTFELNDGAIPGAHKVTVTKLTEAQKTAATNAPPPANDASQMGSMAKNYLDTMNKNKARKEKPAVPAIYGSPATTPLNAEVKAGGNEPFVFQLKD